MKKKKIRVRDATQCSSADTQEDVCEDDQANRKKKKKKPRKTPTKKHPEEPDESAESRMKW